MPKISNLSELMPQSHIQRSVSPKPSLDSLFGSQKPDSFERSTTATSSPSSKDNRKTAPKPGPIASSQSLASGTTLVDLKDELLPGFTKRTPVKTSESISDDSLLLVRMTDFKPREGIIQSAREATRNSLGVGGQRNSLHFALNHAVLKNTFGVTWAKSNYGILMPFDKTVELNGKGKFIAGNPADIFTDGSVKIPRGSVIVRYDAKISGGKLRVLNAEAVEEFKSLKGVKIIDTSSNVQGTTDKVVAMMGYTLKRAEFPYGWGKIEDMKQGVEDALEGLSRWREFASKNGIKNAAHVYTPSSRAEDMVQCIELLTPENAWKGIGLGSEVINYKEEFLNVIEDIEETALKGYHLSFDVKKLKEIIQEAETPKEAMKRIPDELKLKPTFNLPQIQGRFDHENLTPREIYINIDRAVGVSPKAKTYHSSVIEFFEKEKVSLNDLKELKLLYKSWQENLAN